MKRPLLVTVANTLQFLLGFLLLGFMAYVLALTRSPEILAEPDAAGTIHGLMIGAAALGVPALITLIGAVGLWKRRFWGWVLSLGTCVGVLAVLVYSMNDERDLDSSESALAVGFVLSAVLLLLPAVRKYFWNTSDAQITVKRVDLNNPSA